MDYLDSEAVKQAMEFPDDKETIDVSMSAMRVAGKARVGFDGLKGMNMDTDVMREIGEDVMDKLDMRRVPHNGSVSVGHVTVREDGIIVDVTVYDDPFDT